MPSYTKRQNDRIKFRSYGVTELRNLELGSLGGSEFQSYGVSGFRSFRFRSFGVTEFQGFGVSEFRSYGVSDFRVSVSLSSKPPYTFHAAMSSKATNIKA